MEADISKSFNMPATLFGTHHGDVSPVIVAKYGWFSGRQNYLKKTGRIPDLASFRHFLAQKGGQMLFDLNFAARFGILSSFSIY